MPKGRARLIVARLIVARLIGVVVWLSLTFRLCEADEVTENVAFTENRRSDSRCESGFQLQGA